MMNQVPDEHRNIEERSADDSVARLLRLAGHRPPIPEWDAALVKRAARKEWQKKVRSRARRTLYLRAGGLLAAAALVLAVGLRFWPSAPVPVATVEAIAGSVDLMPAPGGEDGRTVFAGTAIESFRGASPSRVALRLAGGASLRLDVGTRLSLVSSTVLELEQGAVYVDSGPAGGAGGVAVRTPLGVASDVGTQFEVLYDESQGGQDASLRVRVREGAVEVARGGDSHRASAGEELFVRTDGTVERAAIPSHGPRWAWVLESAPVPEIEGRPLVELVEWFAREGGWELRFADAAAEEVASTGVMHGSLQGSTAEEGVVALLRANKLAHRAEGGELVIGTDQP